MTPAEFRRLGHQVVDWIADYREKVGTLPVMSSGLAGVGAGPAARSPAVVARERTLRKVARPRAVEWAALLRNWLDWFGSTASIEKE